MSRPPSSQTTPQLYRVSDRDLTEIELHSVDSINDLHRTHHEHKTRPPRPAYTPSPNGNLFTRDITAVNQRGPPVSSQWQSHLQDMLTPSSSRAYALGCAIITLLLLTVFLIFYFLQQGGAIRMLTEAVREKEAA
uniref:Si:dkey-20d21.12 n=1 Tax=Seriola dumerili TaxID=41447 RepID=A0A3B4UTA8_SERDU